MVAQKEKTVFTKRRAKALMQAKAMLLTKESATYPIPPVTGIVTIRLTVEVLHLADMEIVDVESGAKVILQGE